VTSKGSITGQLQRALAKRDVLAVRSLAGELPTVPLHKAISIKHTQTVQMATEIDHLKGKIPRDGEAD
jgi:hypothetical protein